MADRASVAVAGTHGKTTTTSLLTVALQHCGADPSFAIGGNLSDSGVNAHSGTGELFVAEADESDGSFLLLHPFAAVVTNVEADHLDHYGDRGGGARARSRRSRRGSTGPGSWSTCADDPGAAPAGPYGGGERAAVLTYGESAGGDVRVDRLRLDGTGSAVRRGARAAARAGTLRIPGRHNALNATAALAAGIELGLPEACCARGWAGSPGRGAGSSCKGEADGVRVFDDYAHHPTEIAAVLRAAREVAGRGRLVVAFQPHRYTRTAAFRRGVRRRARPGRRGHRAGGVRRPARIRCPGRPAPASPRPSRSVPGTCAFEPSWSAVAARLADAARPGDVVLTLGAGDVTMIGPEVVALLSTREPAS